MIATMPPTIWPKTVAIAAPVTPMAGMPSAGTPKISSGSQRMLVIAPVHCEIIESIVRPVA